MESGAEGSSDHGVGAEAWEGPEAQQAIKQLKAASVPVFKYLGGHQAKGGRLQCGSSFDIPGPEPVAYAASLNRNACLDDFIMSKCNLCILDLKQNYSAQLMAA